MAESRQDIRRNCLKLLLRPLVRYCLKRAFFFQDFINAAKEVFVEAAEEEIRKSTEKINVSRLSAMTGVHRQDVTRIFKKKEPPTKREQSLAHRVVAQWQHDQRFRNSSGKPRTLRVVGEGNDFHRLVSSVSKDLNPATVLFELERAGAAKRTSRGVKLTSDLLMERYEDIDLQKGFELLSRDLETTIFAAEQNVVRAFELPNLHIRTEYDNISQKAIPEIRQWVLDEGKKFHKRVREYLSGFDKDVNPAYEDENVKDFGAKVVVSAVSMTEESPEPSSGI